MIEQFHFLRPWCLLLLLPLLGVIWFMLTRQRDSGVWRGVIDERLLPFLLSGEVAARQRWNGWIPGLVVLLGIIALAGPTWERLPQLVYQKETALVIALDLSRSMDATDIKPSRLARARHKIADILNLRKEGQTALVVYAADAFTVTPLTSDVDTILALLPDLETELMPAQGTRADRAIGRALELFANSGIEHGDVLLVSDGLSELELARVESQLQGKPAQRISVLVIGTREGGPVPLKNGGFLKDRTGAIVIADMREDNLRRLARIGNGVYATISASDLDINTLSYLMESSVDEREARRSDRSTELWRELGPWLLLLALPFAALSFRRGLLWLVPICVLALPPDAQALDWQAWWKNSDQRAGDLFAEGEHAAAAELFERPDWKAAAKYRAGDFDAALDGWRQSTGEDSDYNRANALAQLGRYEDALAAYDQLLKQNPGHGDARYNKQAIEDWLKQQQSEQQQEQQPGSGQQQQGDDGSKAEAEAGQSQQEPGDQAQSDESKQGSQQQAQQQDQQTEGQQSDSQQQSAPTQASEDAAAKPQQDEALANLDQQMSEQATEQWLRKIPDDPGGLLRRKFIYQYKQRGGVDAEAQSW